MSIDRMNIDRIMRRFCPVLLSTIIVATLPMHAHSQVSDTHDLGWSAGISVGRVYLNDVKIQNSLKPLHTESKSFPSATALVLEYKPFRSVSFDASISRPLSEEIEDGVFYGTHSSVLLMVGGNFYLDNPSIISPYLTTDVGLSFTSLYMEVINKDLDGSDVLTAVFDDRQLPHVAQIGAGVGFDVGPVRLDVVYNYIIMGGYDTGYLYFPDSVDLATEPLMLDDSIEDRKGHKIELRVIVPAIF